MSESNLKPKADCVCGCGLFGTLLKRPEGHVRGCACPRCRGKRNRAKGLSKQREARKRLGVAPSHKFGDANEERWNDQLFANEVKSGAQIKAAVTAWLKIEMQVQSNEAQFGSRRKPCRAVLMPDDWGKEGLVMVRLSTWEELVRPAMEAFYES